MLREIFSYFINTIHIYVRPLCTVHCASKRPLSQLALNVENNVSYKNKMRGKLSLSMLKTHIHYEAPFELNITINHWNETVFGFVFGNGYAVSFLSHYFGADASDSGCRFVCSTYWASLLRISWIVTASIQFISLNNIMMFEVRTIRTFIVNDK